jgi:hypothetical protein
LTSRARVTAVLSSSRVITGDAGGGSTTAAVSNCEPWLLCTVTAHRRRAAVEREIGRLKNEVGALSPFRVRRVVRVSAARRPDDPRQALLHAQPSASRAARGVAAPRDAGPAPQSIPLPQGCVASSRSARVGVEPLSGRDCWPQGQPRTPPHSQSGRRERVSLLVPSGCGPDGGRAARLSEAMRSLNAGQSWRCASRSTTEARAVPASASRLPWRPRMREH